MADFRFEFVLKCFNINVPHYHAKWPFLCFSLRRRKRGQKKTLILYWFLQVKTKNDNFDKKAKKKRGQQTNVNNGRNVTSHVRR